MTTPLRILSLIDGVPEANGYPALATLAAWQSELERAGTTIAELPGPVTDPAAVERFELARRDLREIARAADRLSRLLSRAVIR